MKKFFSNVKARFNKTTASVKARVECAKVAVENKRGEGYMKRAFGIRRGYLRFASCEHRERFVATQLPLHIC